jgi:hypothetical protein
MGRSEDIETYRQDPGAGDNSGFRELSGAGTVSIMVTTVITTERKLPSETRLMKL